MYSQARVEISEGRHRKAALPPDVRKGSEAVNKLGFGVLCRI